MKSLGVGALAFALAAWLDLSLLGMLLVYSLASTAAFLFYLACAWRAARAAAHAHHVRPAPAEETAGL